jgi:hypothetical protein
MGSSPKIYTVIFNAYGYAKPLRGCRKLEQEYDICVEVFKPGVYGYGLFPTDYTDWVHGFHEINP